MVSRPWTIHHIHSVANEQYFLLPLLSLLGKRRGAKHELQGRRKLPNSRWASSDMGGAQSLVECQLIFQNLDGQLPTLPTHPLRP